MTDGTETGVLYVVATPLGNLDDLSPRAVQTLGAVRLVACEDTRRTGQLLRAHALTTATISYHEHNENARTPELIDKLRAGDSIALVSDAGTPAISDPGERLVAAAHAAGIPVRPLPGPSAAITALSVSGLPTARFLFVGFLPSRRAERRRAIEELRDRGETLVLYESPQRVLATLADLLELCGERAAFLCREATKVHEEYVPGTLRSLHALLERRAAIKGEVVLVVHGHDGAAAPRTEVDAAALLHGLRAQGLTPRAAARAASRLTGRPARELYKLLLGAPAADDAPD